MHHDAHGTWILTVNMQFAFMTLHKHVVETMTTMKKLYMALNRMSMLKQELDHKQTTEDMKEWDTPWMIVHYRDSTAV